MLLLLSAAALVAFQQTSVTVSVDSKKGAVVRVIAREGRDSTRDASHVRKPIVATSEQLATAFADASARSLLTRAREARLGQDSSIRSYDASTLQRLTLGLAFTKIGRERIFFRHEAAARVRWARGVGAHIDVQGKRTAVPMLGGSGEVDIESVLSPVPYYPGRDALWMGMVQAKASANVDDIVHPLANSAEAFYTYRTGDSVTFRLPDGTTVQIRELEVRPRKPDWHAVVGSLWFDTRTGQLVRAAYRMSQPFDLLDDDDDDDDGFLARAMLRPATASITGVAVEYGLYQGKFWLPRTQAVEGGVHVGFMRMPMRIEERFSYADVNALDSLPIIPPPDTTLRGGTLQERVHRDSVYTARRAAECASTGAHTMRATRYGGTLPVLVSIPCDTAALAHAPALPPSIFDSADEIFGDAERDALLARASALMPSVPLGPGLPLPRAEWGFNLLRYNRVEGLSSAIDVTESLGSYALRFTPRIGVADRIPNAELSFSRTSGLGTTSLTAYKRLAASNDWGNPLDFGSGLSALLFGRDEGFYYRAAGAEVTGDHLLAKALQWRVFHEEESDAAARTNFSLPHAFGSDGFEPLANITATRIRETGASLRDFSSFGLDPSGFRLVTDLRLEAATGGRDYGRAALDASVSHPIGRLLGRSFSTAVTLGAGTSVGELPAQRLWYLGGTSSIRGEPAGVMAGDSYWLTHTELGYGSPGMRRVAFLDLGWAGDRSAWSDVGRPASGVGIGLSFLDGLIRADVARGLYPREQWHTALYLEAKF